MGPVISGCYFIICFLLGFSSDGWNLVCRIGFLRDRVAGRFPGGLRDQGLFADAVGALFIKVLLMVLKTSQFSAAGPCVPEPSIFHDVSRFFGLTTFWPGAVLPDQTD